MIIIDGHLDLAMNALLWNRDLTQTVAAIRSAEAGMVEKGRGAGTVALPELRAGRVALTMARTVRKWHLRRPAVRDRRAARLPNRPEAV